jgi:hypothetical protein
MMNSQILAIIGLLFSVVAMLFIILSDFGCSTGNIGSIGLTGEIGITGLTGSLKQVISSKTDMTNTDLTLGYIQSSIVGNLLKSNGYMLSTWLMSVIGQSVEFTMNFEVLNNDIVVPLTPLPTIKVTSALVANVRKEVGLKLYIWKTDDKTFKVCVEEQSSLFTGTIENYNTANIAIKLKVSNSSAYNRYNTLTVYQDTENCT